MDGWTIATAAAALRQRRISSLELTRECLQRIAQLDGAINAFILVTAELALEQARNADAELASGRDRGPLHGIPIALKDLIDIAGLPTTAASKVFLQNVANSDAAVVERLRVAGAVFIGKTNLHECAYGGSSVISHFGAVRNPCNPDHIAGGSSSGSAAAVAAGMCLAAIGTDTAGSIRLPASCCGVVGLKPTYGLVSVRGVLPLAWSYDHVGPLARTVGDCGAVLEAIAGYDSQDPYSRTVPARSAPSLHQLRVGIPSTGFLDDMDPRVGNAFQAAVATLASMTRVVEGFELTVDADRTVAAAESYAFHREHVQARAQDYHPETLRRIRAGDKIPEAEYRAKLAELERLRAAPWCGDVEVAVTPTVIVSPPLIAELLSDLPQLRKHEMLLLRNTRPFNVLGWPAISLPCGATEEGLPIGIQIVAPAGGDGTVIAVASALERART